MPTCKVDTLGKHENHPCLTWTIREMFEIRIETLVNERDISDQKTQPWGIEGTSKDSD